MGALSCPASPRGHLPNPRAGGDCSVCGIALSWEETELRAGIIHNQEPQPVPGTAQLLGLAPFALLVRRPWLAQGLNSACGFCGSNRSRTCSSGCSQATLRACPQVRFLQGFAWDASRELQLPGHLPTFHIPPLLFVFFFIFSCQIFWDSSAGAASLELGLVRMEGLSSCTEHPRGFQQQSSLRARHLGSSRHPLGLRELCRPDQASHGQQDLLGYCFQR